MVAHRVVISMAVALLATPMAFAQTMPPKDPRDNVGRDPRDRLERQPSNAPDPNRVTRRLGKVAKISPPTDVDLPDNAAYVSTAHAPVQRQPVPGSAEFLEPMSGMDMYTPPSASGSADGSVVTLPGMALYRPPSADQGASVASGTEYPAWWPK